MNPLFILLYVATIFAVFVSGVPVPEEETDGALHEISKRSLIRDLGNPLTGVEKISKRSISRDIGPHLDGMEKISKRAVSDDFAKEEDEQTPLRERRYVFMPGFARRRQGRSVSTPLEEVADVLEANDVFKEDRERRAVFMPGFARRRSGRSVVFSPGFAKRRQGRSVEDPQVVDEEEPGREKRSVFLPGFARRQG